MFQIPTSRLILRDLQEDDAPLIRHMAHEDAIRRYQRVLRLESEDAIVEFIGTAIFHNNQQPRQGFNLVVVERQQKQSIGWIGWG
ncbi:MAG TPA: GNAT family N-acetyltransferase, partial [Terriglobales bacterium]|nr:GNAT family N-acetyltransferase [Terriglobales bacterium]